MIFLNGAQIEYKNASKTEFQIILAIFECINLGIWFCFLNRPHYFELTYGFKLLLRLKICFVKNDQLFFISIIILPYYIYKYIL